MGGRTGTTHHRCCYHPHPQAQRVVALLNMSSEGACWLDMVVLSHDEFQASWLFGSKLPRPAIQITSDKYLYPLFSPLCIFFGIFFGFFSPHFVGFIFWDVFSDISRWWW